MCFTNSQKFDNENSTGLVTHHPRRRDHIGPQFHLSLLHLVEVALSLLPWDRLQSLHLRKVEGFDVDSSIDGVTDEALTLKQNKTFLFPHHPRFCSRNHLPKHRIVSYNMTSV